MPIRDAVLARTDRFTDETGVGVVDVPAEEDLNPLQLDGLVVSLVADSEEETNLERLADVLRTAFPGLRTAWEYAETGVPVLYVYTGVPSSGGRTKGGGEPVPRRLIPPVLLLAVLAGSGCMEPAGAPVAGDPPTPLTRSQAISVVRGCLERLEPTPAVAAALAPLRARTVAVPLEELGETRPGWLVQGGEVEDVGAPAWRVLEDTREVVAALPSAVAIAPGPAGRLCRFP